MGGASPFRAVIFDWPGTLVATLDEREWLTRSLRLAGRVADEASVREVLVALRPVQPRLAASEVDVDAGVHRRAYLSAFAHAGLDEPLAEALYAVESDTSFNPFALDVAPTLAALRGRGSRIGVLSDIHIDIRPALAAAGLDDLVDVFTLSFEHAMVKPDPALYAAALAGLGARAEDTLMVGDRSVPDGGAVEAGLGALLLPPLRQVSVAFYALLGLSIVYQRHAERFAYLRAGAGVELMLEQVDPEDRLHPRSS